MSTKRKSIIDIINMKGNEPIACLTAYTAPFAKILDKHADLLLVGDTLGMVVYGMESTLAVTLNMMINHGTAVVKASSQACIVVDMPFGSYQVSPQIAYKNAVKILQRTNCNAVKLEGGAEMAETVKFLTERGIAVMGHIGLMPQHVNQFGGYYVQGRSGESQEKLYKDAIALENSGAFAVVLECVQSGVSAEITAKLNIPTIGIGASVDCDGQILVTEDMSGIFSDFTPKFVKQYGNLAESLSESAKLYCQEVKNKKFPAKEHSY